MERKLGRENPLSVQLAQSRMSHGRACLPQGLREEVYRHLLRTIRQRGGNVEIGLCPEEPSMFDLLDMGESMG